MGGRERKKKKKKTKVPPPRPASFSLSLSLSSTRTGSEHVDVDGQGGEACQKGVQPRADEDVDGAGRPVPIVRGHRDAGRGRPGGGRGGGRVHRDEGLVQVEDDLAWCGMRGKERERGEGTHKVSARFRVRVRGSPQRDAGGGP